MSLTRMLASHFTRPVQSRGRNYYSAGAVHLNEIGPRFAAATVRGSEMYDVELSLESNTVHARCSCPFANQCREPCKHIWATVLKVDAQRGMADAFRRGRVGFRLDVDERDGEREGAFDPERSRSPQPAQPRTARRGRRRSGSWKERFAEVRQGEPLDDAHRSSPA